MRGIYQCYLVFIVCLILLHFLYLILQESIKPDDYRVTKSVPKYILMYEVPPWMKILPIVNLDVECVVTSDKNYFPDLRKFDAVVFSGSKPWSADEIFPSVRSPHQYYVLAEHESPFFAMHKFSVDISKYNLTMTHRRDSDIYWPYGFISNQSIDYVSELVAPLWKTPKTAAWFVSNCNARSKRNEVVSSLQQHVDIDVYGKCGTLKCERTDEQQCYKLVEEEYFFYFSFENSLCKDYLTEKVFNIMKYFVVPVVFGGANYSHFLPPQSYIDANDFATAKDLANFLRNLANNPEEYIKYFWWKSHYKTLSTRITLNNLCKKLHEFTSDVNEGQFVRIYKNISSWLNDNQYCLRVERLKGG
ncbi:alpha-(1,3)-fucosyltransferase C-like [Phlebotomus argentipes]|uniref:alpha-(1,3)-fucosyltransferase C-like n=1 Tax=Phlebotomus argentipes TaxID=94469 RepID=UPI0028933C60|nr:alpha-(1,3)-fucosyltransferase C-like [Phlebotomus argentipes]